MWPERPGLAVAGPEQGGGVEQAASKLFGVGAFGLGAGEEIHLEPPAEGVCPADHRGPDAVAGGVLERKAIEASLFELFDVLFDVGVFAL